MPLLSVIVPVYNVEPYLGACLESLAAQTWRDLEVVMVDDGSTDDGARIAEEYRERDPRFRLLRQPNAGLGAARNAGLRRASGEFVAFLDSDDMLPLHALETMAGSLLETGSDLVSGNVKRFSGRGLRRSAMHRTVCARPLRRAHIASYEALMRDRLVTNKLWRRSFWDEQGFAFPEGVLYEDIGVALPAHFLAKAVDVLTADVYLWRDREGEQQSITQDRARVKGVEDRFAAVRSVRGFLLSSGFAEHVPAWDRTVLDSDLFLFMKALPRGDDDFRRRFMELAGAYLDEAGPGVPASLPAPRRVLWHLVRQGRLADVLEALVWERTGEPRAVRRGGRYHLKAPVDGVPAEVTRLRDDLALLQRVDDVRREGGRLVVEGRATVRHLRPEQRVHQQVFASLVRSGDGRRIRVPVTAVRAAPIEYPRGSSRRRDWGGFRLVVDPGRLSGGPEASTWHVELLVVHRGMVRRDRLRFGGPESARRDVPRNVPELGFEVSPGTRMVTGRAEDDAFTIRLEPERFRLTGRTVSGDRLRLTGRSSGSPVAPVLELVREPGGTVLSYPLLGGDGPPGPPASSGRPPGSSDLPASSGPSGSPGSSGSFRAEFDLRDVLPERLPRLDPAGPEAAALDTKVEWRARIADGEAGETWPVLDGLGAWRGVRGGREVVVAPSPAGELTLRVQPPAATVERAEWSSGTADATAAGELTAAGGATAATGARLLLAGRFADAGETPERLVVLSADRDGEWSFPVRCAGDRFEAVVTPAAAESLAGTLPLPEGRYGLALRTAGRDLPLETGHGEAEQGPAEQGPAGRGAAGCGAAGRRFAFEADGTGHAVLTVHGDLADDERGAENQRRLRTGRYQAWRGEPLRQAVLFDGQAGRRFAGDPKAVYEELRRRGTGLETLWVVRDGQVELPPDVTPVRRGGADHYEALARCRYVVTDVHLPPWFEHRDGQTVLQTRHDGEAGHPGAGAAGPSRTAADRERPAGQAAQWDYLVSPGPWCTPVLRGAPGFTGEVLETGRPRNDVLVRPGREELAARVRRRIGLPPGRRAVLYVPALREDRPRGKDRYRFDLRLDLARMRERLGPDHVVLVRRHPDAVGGVPGADDGFTVDVSAYPDVQELLLVADVLVTDYSPAVFGFALTGRPILFYTYDLERRRDRGLDCPFDLARAPGPLLRTTEEVAAALCGLDAVAGEYAERRASFAAEYCGLDDGSAAARVVEAVFGP
ncbi:CDP-glycerol glycerophosphotransferase family protein [Planomonospora sp. ID91781]|uniref:bifunctional glycosyltransferase/CDP-glycerol:glycerophosphate glycerophosphotransferase n=1 Tax=Planomonospora sp. ID91781 TaxID=2738135 RepID=UPI0018C3BDAE|nr:CDP-glycerol glycerophosphotransferase family protein [Planomonospora sp. ID91781]MBG0820761.1 CDP-glycerol glycerophosphotransferase family protein [Planomonospora sp. ID91781]